MAKKPEELLGETLREIGILFMVFGPLDAVLKGNDFRLADGLIGSGVAFLGIVLVIAGLMIEWEE